MKKQRQNTEADSSGQRCHLPTYFMASAVYTKIVVEWTVVEI
jgi:hypothetical protein